MLQQMELDVVDGDGDEDDVGGDGGGDGVRSCPYCDITCSSVRDLRLHQTDRHLSQLEVLQCHLCSFVSHWQADWSTLIGRGPTLLRSHWSRASLVMLAPAVLCHK